MAVETLSAPHWGAAFALIGGAFGEVPAYRWILGEYVDDPDAGTALATVVAGPIAEAGGLVGVRDGDRVVAALVWYHLGVTDAVVDSGRMGAHLAVLADRPTMARRLIDFWSRETMQPPVSDAVHLAIGVTDPSYRHAGLLHAMVEPIEDYCLDHDVPFYAWTGREELRDAYRDSFAMTEYATEQFEGMTVYGLTTARPPLPTSVRPPRS